MKIYLAHGKHNIKDGKWLEYRIEEWGYEVYNPFDGSELAAHLTKSWERAEEKDAVVEMRDLCKSIYKKDTQAINHCDITIVYLPDLSIGTIMEIPIAKLVYYKQVIVLTDIIHPFIEALADYVFPINPFTLQMLKELLETLRNE